MLKLMKYEFRKMRTTLFILLAVLVGLEIMFALGNRLDRRNWVLTSVVLLTIMGFATYGYLLAAGVISYSRELKDRTGYLTFMTPVRPIGVVLSKLLFTLLAATVITALFALAATMDYRWLINGVLKGEALDPSLLNQANLSLKFMLGDASVTINSLAQLVAFTLLSVLIEVMLSMCTAYLAITVSATVMQNRKGFLRGLVSVLLFIAITWASSWLSDKLTNLVAHTQSSGSLAAMDQAAMLRMLWASLGLHFVLGGIFAVISASLLKRKVSL